MGLIGETVADRIIKPLGDALFDENTDIVLAAAYALSRVGPVKSPETRNRLIQLLESNNYELRKVTAFALGQLTPNAREIVQPLIKALRDEYYGVREKAAFSLGNLPPDLSQQAIQPLIEALNDENIDVRYNAVGALGNIGGLSVKAFFKFEPGATTLDCNDFDGNVRSAIKQIQERSNNQV